MSALNNEQLFDKITAALNTATASFDSKAEMALKEAQKAGELSTETRAVVDKALTEIGALSQTHAALKEQLEKAEQTFARGGRTTAEERVPSPGAQVLAYAGLKDFAARVNSHERTRISVPIRNVRAALTSADVAPDVVEPQREPGIVPRLRQRLFVRDLLSAGRTESPSIYWVQQTGFTNSAAVVPEGTKKPESTIAYTTKSTPVTTIAHLFKASKQIMDDFAQLQSDINTEMTYGLKYVEEQEILFGDGTGAHLKGIVPQASAFSAAFVPSMPNAIDTIRLAMLQAQLARLPATGIVLHYTDWAQIELLKDSQGGYLIANPLNLLGPVLWGIPVVATEIPAMVGKFLTGGFAGGAQIYDREDANVVIATENVDDFERNMITIRCEERLALAVKRPEAFVYGNLAPTP